MTTILNLESSGEFTFFNSVRRDTDISYRYEIALEFEGRDDFGYSLDAVGFSVWINGESLDQVSEVQVSNGNSFIPFDQALGNGFELLMISSEFEWNHPEGGLAGIGLDLYAASPPQTFDVGATPEDIVQQGVLGDFTVSEVTSTGEPVADYLGLSLLTPAPIPEVSSTALLAIGAVLALTNRLRKHSS